MLDSIPTVPKKKLSDLYPKASAEALELLGKLLQFNPDKRITGLDCLKHPYVSLFHNEDEEPNCKHPIKLMLNDNKKYTIQEYRDKLYNEIKKKREKKRKQQSLLAAGVKTGTTTSSTTSSSSASSSKKPGM